MFNLYFDKLENGIITNKYIVDEDYKQPNSTLFVKSDSASFPIILDDNGKWQYQYVMNLSDGEEKIMQGNSGYIIKAKINEYKYDIEYYKKQKCDLVDENTRTIINKGFTYNNRKFSLSNNAQTTWTNLRANFDLFTFPIEITSQDGDGKYLLELNELDDFTMAGIGAFKGTLDSGRELISEINNMNDVNDVYDFDDYRII